MSGAYVRSPRALWRWAGQEVLLARPGREGIDRLSESAAAVWRRLETPRTLQGLVEELADVYDAPLHDIAGDVEPLLTDLVQRGWIEEVAQSDG